MCGIAGIIGKDAREERVRPMISAIAHRGPDGEGIAQLPFAAFGHRRLSIIDLSDAGHQPMTSTDGRFVITFNGELYNYRELRAELSDYPFQSHTDTEVVLAAWSKWGEKALERFLGMFAFAIADLKQETVTLVRDRLGIKPLFYTEQNGAFYFGSEIKALLAAGISSKPNESIVADYLLYGYYEHRPETFFEGILSLRGGHLLTWKNGQTTIRRWWNLPERVEPILGLSDQEYIDAFQGLLDSSLRMHLRSDVSVGVNLSSGVDSVSLLYELKRVTNPKELHVFSMGFADPAHDETKDIAALVHAEGIPFHRVEIGPQDYIDYMEETLRALDQPFGGLSTIAYLKMMKTPAKLGIKVLLEGQGVDEILAGYKYFYPPYLKDAYAQGEWGILWQAVRRAAQSRNPLHLMQASFQLSNMVSAPAIGTFQDLTSFLRTDCLRADWMTRAKKEPPVFEAPFESHLSNALYRDLTFTKLPRVLRFNDHASMASGLELRVPYLDHRIVEFAFCLPNRWKIQNGMTKVLLRKTMEGVVPDELRLRQKRPQSSPQTVWYKGALQESVLREFQSDTFKDLPFVDAKAVERAFQSFVKNPKDNNSFFFWQLINLSRWYTAHS